MISVQIGADDAGKMKKKDVLGRWSQAVELQFRHMYL